MLKGSEQAEIAQSARSGSLSPGNVTSIDVGRHYPGQFGRRDHHVRHGRERAATRRDVVSFALRLRGHLVLRLVINWLGLPDDSRQVRQ
jgi:hypothetical protein